MIGRITELDEAAFENFATQVTGPASFEIEEDQLDKLAENCGWPVEQIQYLLAALSFLYDRLESVSTQEISRNEQTRQILVELELFEDEEHKLEELTQRLWKLLQHNDSHEVHKKVRRLQDGFTPISQNFHSFVDLRPSISPDRKSVEGFVTIIQLNIKTSVNEGPEAEYTLHLNKAALAKLKLTIDDIDKKIQLIESNPEIYSQLLDVS